MKQYIQGLVQKYRRTGVLPDSNLLVLYFVGLVNLRQIENFNRTKNFVEEDYHTLVNILKNFTTVVTTPNILTEASNFLGQLPEKLHPRYFEKFARGITLLDEHYVPSNEISTMNEFSWLHLTDSGIVSLAKDRYLVITADARLANHLGRKGVDVINFNHIRTAYWK